MARSASAAPLGVERGMGASARQREPIRVAQQVELEGAPEERWRSGGGPRNLPSGMQRIVQP